MKIFNIKRRVFFFSVLVSLSFHLSSQNNLELGCGTVTTAESLKYFNTIQPELKKYETEFLTLKTSKTKLSKSIKDPIPVKAHIIRASNGTGGLSLSELENAITNVNQIFSNAFMEFSLLDDIDYIDSDNYYHFKSCDENELVEAKNVSGVINIYFTDNIENDSDESVCGYTRTEKRSNVIIMKNSCTTNDSSLAHEIGHLFSLIHTHGLDNNQLTTELVNGTNCSTDGDQICDTPADPMLTLNNLNNFCRYIGTQTDANGEVFNPDSRNIMSYSLKGCRSHFSTQQLARVYAFYQAVKTDYLNDPSKTDKIIVNNLDETKTDLLTARLYPNPITNNQLYIKPNNFDEVIYYEISNVMGQVISMGWVTNQPINVSALTSGTYLITLKNKNSKIIKKIIK
tara:strand:+ start:14688 stop:15884 length:1197 start_codon:yes stop_codon:yes gene_type:complete